MFGQDNFLNWYMNAISRKYFQSKSITTAPFLKCVTNRDWKVTRLIISSSRISDEGLKNLSTALTQSELYSLILYGVGLQSQGLEHLCEAPISGECNLTSLNVSDQRLGDEGIIHLCNALSSVNCKLTNSTVTGTFFEKTKLKHLCDALISTNIRSVANLNIFCNRLGEEGIVLLFTILTGSNCKLTSLNVSHNRLGDRVLKDLPEALTNKNCTLTGLDISDNELGDKGIKYLCKALTDTN